MYRRMTFYCQMYYIVNRKGVDVIFISFDSKKKKKKKLTLLKYFK
jgi:hypothetical protein